MMFDGTQVRRNRDERKMSAKEVAAQIGVSRPYIHLIETGQRVPHVDIQRKLESLLGIRQNENRNESTSEVTEVSYESMEFLNENVAVVGDELPDNASKKMHISVPMLFGMVQGSLLFIESTIRDFSFANLDCRVKGTVARDEGESQSNTDFCIQGTRQSVVLSFKNTTSINSWLFDSKYYSRMPDLMIKYGLQNVDFVWFTDYVSVFYKVHQCKQWQVEKGGVIVLNDALNRYIQSTDSVTLKMETPY